MIFTMKVFAPAAERSLVQASFFPDKNMGEIIAPGSFEPSRVPSSFMQASGHAEWKIFVPFFDPGYWRKIQWTSPDKFLPGLVAYYMAQGPASALNANPGMDVVITRELVNWEFAGYSPVSVIGNPHVYIPSQGLIDPKTGRIIPNVFDHSEWVEANDCGPARHLQAQGPEPPKVELNTWCQRHKWRITYETKRREGPAHAPYYTVEAKLFDGPGNSAKTLYQATSHGNSVSAASANCATIILEQIESSHAAKLVKMYEHPYVKKVGLDSAREEMGRLTVDPTVLTRENRAKAEFFIRQAAELSVAMVCSGDDAILNAKVQELEETLKVFQAQGPGSDEEDELPELHNGCTSIEGVKGFFVKMDKDTVHDCSQDDEDDDSTCAGCENRPMVVVSNGGVSALHFPGMDNHIVHKFSDKSKKFSLIEYIDTMYVAFPDLVVVTAFGGPMQVHPPERYIQEHKLEMEKIHDIGHPALHPQGPAIESAVKGDESELVIPTDNLIGGKLFSEAGLTFCANRMISAIDILKYPFRDGYLDASSIQVDVARKEMWIGIKPSPSNPVHIENYWNCTATYYHTPWKRHRRVLEHCESYSGGLHYEMAFTTSHRCTIEVVSIPTAGIEPSAPHAEYANRPFLRFLIDPNATGDQVIRFTVPWSADVPYLPKTEAPGLYAGIQLHIVGVTETTTTPLTVHAEVYTKVADDFLFGHWNPMPLYDIVEVV